MSLYRDPGSLPNFSLGFLNAEEQFDIECVMQWSIDPEKVKDCLHVDLGDAQERVEVPQGQGTEQRQSVPQQNTPQQPAQPQQIQGAEAVPPAAQPVPAQVADPRSLSASEPAPLTDTLDTAGDGAWLVHELAATDAASGKGLSAQLQSADNFTQGQLGLLAAAGLMVKPRPKTKPH